MTDEYSETGGLLWGPGIFYRMYSHMWVSWPFGHVRVSSERILFTVTNWRGDKVKYEFDLQKSDLTRIEPRREMIRRLLSLGGLLGTTIQFIHTNSDCPEVLMYSTLTPKRLLDQLCRLGYVNPTC